MRNLFLVMLLAFSFSSCTHIQLSGWEDKTYELCCTGNCESSDVWQQKNQDVCSGTAELLSGENRSEVMGVRTHRSRRFSHSQVTRRDVHCRRFRCSGNINPSVD